MLAIMDFLKLPFSKRNDNNQRTINDFCILNKMDADEDVFELTETNIISSRMIPSNSSLDVNKWKLRDNNEKELQI